MREINLNGKTYGFKEWEDLTLNQAKAIIDIPIPEKLKKHLETGNLLDSTPNEELDVFPRYYIEVILALSDIPREEFEIVKYGFFRHVQYITDFFYKYCLEYLLALSNAPKEDTLTSIISFDFKGEEYIIPSDKKIAEMIIPLADEKAITFVESTQLMSSMFETKTIGIENMALIIAILCRKDREEYNEQTALKRAEDFKELTMDIVWGIFFYIIGGLNISVRRLNILSGITQRHLERMELQSELQG